MIAELGLAVLWMAAALAILQLFAAVVTLRPGGAALGAMVRPLAVDDRDAAVATTAAIVAAASVSITKSRSDTASRLLAVGASKPRACAVISRSIGNPVPASAALPSGHSLSRARASAKRLRSRRSIS